VRAGYGRIEVLHGIDMSLPFGTTVALVGANGAGKSTVLRVLAGLVRVRAGEMLLDGAPVGHGSAHARAARGLTLVPDERNVFPSLTVAENLDLFAGRGATDAALRTFPELRPLLERRCSTLSGGERQMVALSHALLHPGRVLLVDEPSRGLAPTVIRRAYDALAGLAAPDRLIVVVEQYTDEVIAGADLVYVIERGRVRFAGEPGELEGAASAGGAGGPDAQPAW
jgi:branched-chain amino acid transport system ATP-binding protein